MKRVFIAIKSSINIEKEVLNFRKDKLNWPVRWIEPKNLHLTLVPPWNCFNLSRVVDKLSKINLKEKSIDLSFNLIDYGPNPNNYRLIWALGEYNEELDNLKNKIEDCLGVSKSKKRLLPHLTIVRFKKKPAFAVKERVDWSESQTSFVLFESVLKKEGAEYNIIKKFNF